MSHPAAIKAAFELLHLPSRVRWQQEAPLPHDVGSLLSIAAGDAAALRAAILASGQSAEAVRQAAIFFLEQVIFSAHSDSYRTLAATPNASTAELRHNMALLMRWLHPDQRPSGHHTVYGVRVTKAWEDVKTPQRRSDYDASIAMTRKTDGNRGRPQSLAPARLKARLIKLGRSPAKLQRTRSWDADAADRGGPHGLVRRTLRKIADTLRSKT